MMGVKIVFVKLMLGKVSLVIMVFWECVIVFLFVLLFVFMCEFWEFILYCDGIILLVFFY